jgi:hypothetical protein
MTRLAWVAAVLGAVLLVVGACDEEPSEWEPVEDDDSGDDDTGDDTDDDSGDDDCAVPLADWEDLVDRCDSAMSAVYDYLGDVDADDLFERCDPCLVACFEDFAYCTTPFVDCFWDCADAGEGKR